MKSAGSKIGEWDGLNALQDAVCMIDRDFRLVSFNESFRQLVARFGVEARAGCQMLEWYSGETKPEQLERFRQIDDGQLVEFTSTHNAGNESMHLWNTYAPLRNERGEVYGAGGFIKDITPFVSACRETEQSLALEKERNRMLQDILHNLDEPVLALDENLCVVMVSKPAIPFLLERGVAATQDFPVTDLLERSSRALVSSKLLEVLGGNTVELQPGLLLTSKVLCQPLRLTDGRVTGVKITSAEPKGEEFQIQPGREEELNHRIEMLSAIQRQLTCLLEDLAERARVWDHLGQHVPGLAFAVNRDYKLLYVKPDFLSKNDSGTTAQGFEFLQRLDERQRKELSQGLSRAFECPLSDGQSLAQLNRGDWTYLPIRDIDGNVTSVVVLAQSVPEVCESHDLEEKELRPKMCDIRIREEVFGLSSMIFEVDLSGVMIYRNGRMTEMAGVENTVLGNLRDGLRHGDMPERWWNRLWQGAENGKISSAMMKLKSHTRDDCWVDMTVVPVKNDCGQIFKYVAACYRFENSTIAEYLFYQQLNRFDSTVMKKSL